ncbi:2-oxoglutarate and oxygenase superfamily protein [Perilla frutescens var. hirtella]|nr:2-oxoglutarate and oxygenase superfamily protein [Perilla frutescens var. frutescens]KAH6787408.1 2-oxoglutarate and oxygenase superfamily protein [Perilla frutescens var. hirtella]
MARGHVDVVSEADQQYDRLEMLKAFDETQAGVKGLIDSGVSKIPKIFVRPSNELTYKTAQQDEVQIPLIDLSDFKNPERRNRIVEQVRTASERWGVFQVVNHGIPSNVSDAMIDGIKRFNETDVEEKRKYYSRDPTRNVRFNSNFDLFTSRNATWKDTLGITSVAQLCSQELPDSCRESTVEYLKHVAVLGMAVMELFSEALGLEPGHLNSMECTETTPISCHYYPACPEPELTIGTKMHSDFGFITLVQQNQISGLQVLYQDQWVDAHHIPGGLLVIIGDLLQLVSNGKFISSKHRVLAKSAGPRISVACFFSGPSSEDKRYGPIRELISEENPPKYREIVFGEYRLKVFNPAFDQYLGLDYYYKL